MKYKVTGNYSLFRFAPKWCTHVIRRNSDGITFYAQDFDYMCKAIDAGGNVEIKIANPTMFTVLAARKPCKDENEWNGEGLPPVDTECEYHDKNGEWIKVKIIYLSEWVIVMRSMNKKDGGVELAKQIHSDEPVFRPVLSEQEIKRDEAIQHINAAMKFASETPVYHVQAENVYNAIAAGKIPGVILEPSNETHHQE